MKGEKIKGITQTAGHITFEFESGRYARFVVEGDCCSNSWIEHVTIPDGVVGCEIVEIRETGEIPPSTPVLEEQGEDIQVYGMSFVTSRGEIIVEFRNSSNGYYGGYMYEEGHRFDYGSDEM